MAKILNPFEYTIYAFLQAHKGRKFKVSEIAGHCVMNIRTAEKYSRTLHAKRFIKRERIKTRTVRGIYLYYFK